MGESFCYHLALTRQSRRLPVVAQLIAKNYSFLILSMSTLPSATVSWWAGFLSTGPLGTTGSLVSRTSPRSRFSWISVFYRQTLVCMLDVSVVTVIPNFLTRQLRSIWLITAPILLLPRQVASLLTVSWNLIGKSWSTWLGLTLRKSRCLSLFGSTQCHTPPK